MNVFKKIFGTSSQREVKAILPLVNKIEGLEEEYKALTDAQLQAKTPEFKQRLADGETLDDILPEAFAACREAAWRVLGMRPYRVQLIGGIILHQGRIAEMRTGEGKTLVATLPAYLNALSGKGVHIITVNDYLAKRDSEWMGKVYRFMGLTVGLVSTASWDRPRRTHTPPTSPTAPTTSSALTTSGTTWPSTPASCAAGPQLRRGGRGGLHPYRRGPHPPDHLRTGREVHPAVHHRGPVRLPPEVPAHRQGGHQGGGGRQHRRRLYRR